MRALHHVRMVTGYGWFRRTTPPEARHALDQRLTADLAWPPRRTVLYSKGNSLFSLSLVLPVSLFDVPPRHGGRTTRAADLEGVEGGEEDTRGKELVKSGGKNLVAVEETDAGGRCGGAGKKDSGGGGEEGQQGGGEAVGRSV